MIEYHAYSTSINTVYLMFICMSTRNLFGREAPSALDCFYPARAVTDCITSSEAECRSRNLCFSSASWSSGHRRSRRQDPATSSNTQDPRHELVPPPPPLLISSNPTSLARVAVPRAPRDDVRPTAKKHVMFSRHAPSGNRTSHSFSHTSGGVVMILKAPDESSGRPSLGHASGTGVEDWAGRSPARQCPLGRVF